jgi:predicted kinase
MATSSGTSTRYLLEKKHHTFFDYKSPLGLNQGHVLWACILYCSLQSGWNMGKAYIICGSPGSGKSTYGKELASRQGAALIDIDTATERIVRLSLSVSGRDPDDRDSDYFKRTFRKPIYDTLFDLARENLVRIDVVIVGPFTREIRDPQWPSMLRDTLNGPVEVHYTYCDARIRKERLSKRANPRDLAKLRDWDNYMKYYGDERPLEFPHIFVDTSEHG